MFSADRKAPNQAGASVATVFFKLVRTRTSIATCLLAGYFCSTRGFQKNPTILALLGSGVPPLHIDTHHNDVGGDAHFM
jgi:hypothetical protein